MSPLRLASAALVAALTVGPLAACAKEEVVNASTPVELGSGDTSAATTPATELEGTTTTEKSPGTTKPKKTTTTTGEFAIPELTGDFCEDLSIMKEAEDSSGDAETDEEIEAVLGLFRDLAASGPDELTSSFDLLIGGMEELAYLDDEDDDSIGKAFAVILDPEFQAAVAAINAYGRDECGLSEDAFDLGPGPDDPNLSDSTTTTFGFPDDDDEPDLGDKLEAAYSSAPWWPAKNGHSISTGSDFADVYIYGDFTAEEALAACQAVEAVAGTDYATLTIQVNRSDDDVSLARRDDTTGNVCVTT